MSDFEVKPLQQGPGTASARQIGGDHYKELPIQPGYFSTENKLTYLEGCAVKRICRHRRGGKGREDIEKAIHELQLILEWVYDA